MSEHQPVILSKKGTTFASEEAAEKELKAQELDPKKFVVGPHEGGFAILDVEALAQKVNPSKPPPRKNMDPFAGPYFLVIFQPKSDPNQRDDVPLFCNDIGLLCQRNKPTILPAAFREIADHAVYNRYSEDGKPIEPIQMYPYTVLREATQSEFQQMRKLGNQERDAYLKKIAATQGTQPVNQAAAA